MNPSETNESPQPNSGSSSSVSSRAMSSIPTSAATVGLSPLVTLLSVAVVGVLFGGFAVILAVPFTSAIATLIDVLVLGNEPPSAQPRRSLRIRSG